MPAPDSPSDRVADTVTITRLRAAIGGEPEHLDWLVRRHSPILAVQADYRLTGPLRPFLTPEDVVLAAWQRGLPAVARSDLGGSRPTRSILRTVSRLVLHHINRQTRKLIRDHTQLAPDAADETSVGTTTPLHRSLSRIEPTERRSLLDALRDISAAQRDLLVLYGIEQNDPTEVAFLTDVRPDQVPRAYRALLLDLDGMIPASVREDLAE